MIESLVGNIKQVSTNITHDLRTPLSHIRQKLETLKKENPDNGIDDVIVPLDNVMDIFSSMLRIAEIESGARKSGFKEFDLSALVSNITETYLAIIEEAKKKFNISITPDLSIKGDRDLIAQLIVNLIENAIQHTPETSVIDIKLHKDDNIRLSVSDNGEGIPEEEMEKITKPFYRLDISRNTPGNGLGLSLVKVIAELHDAVIILSDNEPGLSVTVRFYL